MRARAGIKQIGIVVLLVVALLLSVTRPGAAAEQNFTDLSSGDADYPYIRFLIDSGVINGYGDGTFRPGARLSRAEMAVLMVRAGGLGTEPVPAAPHYIDVKPDFWGYASIEAATAAGLLKGYDDGTFRPDEPVSRAETAAILLRLTSAPLPDMALPSEVQDVPAGHWAERIVAVAIDSAIMPLATKTGFAPDIPASRAEAARGLARMINIMPEKARVPLVGTLIPKEGKVTVTVNGSAREITVPTPCTAGCLISTGDKSSAEIQFSDGSGLKLNENTSIIIKTAQGQTTILKNGAAGALIDNLEIELSEGCLIGALASTYINEDDSSTARAGWLGSGDRGYRYALASLDNKYALRLAADNTKKAELPWYKEPYKKKVRVKVDMPWGVAAIRGTMWMNIVSPSGQSTNVASGSVEVGSGEQSVIVQAGQGTLQSSPGQPPAPPQPLNQQQQQSWVQQQSWIAERANAIEQSAPVVGTPPTIQQQIQQAPSQVTVPPSPQQVSPLNPIPGTPAGSPNQTNVAGPNQTPSLPGQLPSPVTNPGGLADQIINSINQVIGGGEVNASPPPSSSSHDSSGGSSPPADTTPPTAPTGVEAQAMGEGEIRVSWAASSDNVGVTGYRIYKSTGSEGPFTEAGSTGASETCYGIDNLPSCTTFYFKITAVDAAGNVSEDSNIVDAATQSFPVNPVIDTLNVTNGTITIVLSSRPELAPEADDFTATCQINSSEATALNLEDFYYDEDKTLTFSFVPIESAEVEQTVEIVILGFSNQILRYTFTIPAVVRTITGTVALPAWVSAPAGGIELELNAWSNEEQYFGSVPTLIIPEGSSTASFDMGLPAAGNYYLSYRILQGSDSGNRLLQQAYYSESGFAANQNQAVMLDLTSNDQNVDFTLLQGQVLSGDLSWNQSLSVDAIIISLFTEAGEYSEVTIANPSADSCDFAIIAPAVSDYRLQYYLSEYTGDKYISNAYYRQDAASTTNWNGASLIDLSSSGKTGISFPLLEGKKISGIISLPAGKTAPAPDGMTINIATWGGNNESSVGTIAVIEAGTGSASYFIVAPPDSGYRLQYSINAPVCSTPDAPGSEYVRTGLKAKAGAENSSTLNYDEADEFTLSEDMGDQNFEIMTGNTVSGTISLPEGEVASDEGLGVEIACVNSELQTFIYDSFTIPPHENSVGYMITAPPADGYILKYRIVANNSPYIMEGYYNSDGTTSYFENAEVIDLSDGSRADLNLTILSGTTISGRVQLADAAAAPSGGLGVSVIVQSLDISGFSASVSCPIPAGENGIDYSVPVPEGSYYISYVVDNGDGEFYVMQAYYSDEGMMEDYGAADAVAGGADNINLTILNGSSITGGIVLPEPAPAGGLPVTVQAAPSPAGYVIERSLIIPSGQSSIEFDLPGLCHQNYYLIYFIPDMYTGNEYVREGYYKENGTATGVDDATVIDTHTPVSGLVFNILSNSP